MIVASGNHVNTTVTSSPFQEMMLLNSADLDHSSRLYNHAKGIILYDGVINIFTVKIFQETLDDSAIYLQVNKLKVLTIVRGWGGGRKNGV